MADLLMLHLNVKIVQKTVDRYLYKMALGLLAYANGDIEDDGWY